jgi:hypothetical protein
VAFTTLEPRQQAPAVEAVSYKTAGAADGSDSGAIPQKLLLAIINPGIISGSEYCVHTLCNVRSEYCVHTLCNVRSEYCVHTLCNVSESEYCVHTLCNVSSEYCVHTLCNGSQVRMTGQFKAYATSRADQSVEYSCVLIS